jgi:hypothetical protein
MPHLRSSHTNDSSAMMMTNEYASSTSKRSHNSNASTPKPKIQMLNFQSAIPNRLVVGQTSNHHHRHHHHHNGKEETVGVSTSLPKQQQQQQQPQQKQQVPLQDWYILVASTPYAISAQLISIPTTTTSSSSNSSSADGDKEGQGGAAATDLPDIIIPDLIHCTPISVWTCTESGLDPTEANTDRTSDHHHHHHPNDDTYATSSSKPLMSSDKTNPCVVLETLSCTPQIFIQEPTDYEFDSDYLQVAIVCGTDRNRVLSIQLSIISYIGMQGCEGRFVLTKSQRGEGIVEPLIVDSSLMEKGDVIVKKKYMKVGGRHDWQIMMLE